MHRHTQYGTEDTHVSYQGHPSWNYWNVSLWIANDESLYASALYCIHRTRNRHEASQLLFDQLRFSGSTHTPDGAPYTRASIQHAMRGLT